MVFYKKAELATRVKKKEESSCRICRIIRVYLFFAIPVLVLLWTGVDVGLDEVEPTDFVVKVVLIALGLSVIRRIYIDFFKSER